MKHPLPIPFTQLRLTRLLNRPTPQRWWDGIPRSFTLNPTPITGIVPPMTPDDTTWKRCSTCKKPIAFAAAYYACSVSTCNRHSALFAFCSVDCWDAHVPVMRHRDAWANEATAPTAAEWARQQEHEREPRRIVVGGPAGASDSGAAARRGGAAPRDVLIVVSKLKHYVCETAGMNTSDDVIEVLSDRVRGLCDAAVKQARAAGRKTAMARDFTRG